MDWLAIGIGLAILTAGAELLVRGASRLAGAFRIPPLIIGLTIVAFGTSAPELAVSLQSAFSGQPEVAIGNVVGSNIANILLILGISSLIIPLTVERRLVWIDVPIMIAFSVLVWGMALDGSLSRWEGGILFCSLIVQTVWLVRQGRAETSSSESTTASDRPQAALLIDTGLLIVGFVMLVWGARTFVDGSINIARAWGVSELVIGLTLVALGTSLPEIATSVVAAIRGERDIAVGNVIGSNMFNLLAVLGATATISPNGIPIPHAAISFDLPVMVIVAFACLPIFMTGHQIERWEGATFLFYYPIYILAQMATVDGTEGWQRTLWWTIGFVSPLTLITLGIVVKRAVRQSRPAVSEVSEPVETPPK